MVPISNKRIAIERSRRKTSSRNSSLLLFAALLFTICLGATTSAQAQAYTLTTSVDPAGGGTVTAPTTYVYDQGLAVVATPNAGWQFVNWTGDTGNLVDPLSASTSIKNPTTANTTVQANFAKITYTLTTSVDPAGGGTVTAPTTYAYDQGLSVVATPNAGWQFVNWTGVGAGNLVSTASPSTAIINPTFADADIQANFVHIEYSLTVNLSGVFASGTVIKSPDKPTYHYGDIVTLRAVDTYPGPGSIFKAWGGDAAGSDYTVDIIIDTDKTVTATFSATYTLSIEKAGTGAGRASVTASSSDPKFPGGEASGTFLYEEGTTVTLTAADIEPSEDVTGSEFETWTVLFGTPGAGFSLGNKNTSVVISDALSVKGDFRGKYMLTSLARSGGTITPAGSTIKYHGESQSYAMLSTTGFVRSDTVIDGFSQGAMASYTFDGISDNHHIIAVFQSGTEVSSVRLQGKSKFSRPAFHPWCSWSWERTTSSSMKRTTTPLTSTATAPWMWATTLQLTITATLIPIRSTNTTRSTNGSTLFAPPRPRKSIQRPRTSGVVIS